MRSYPERMGLPVAVNAALAYGSPTLRPFSVFPAAMWSSATDGWCSLSTLLGSARRHDVASRLSLIRLCRPLGRYTDIAHQNQQWLAVGVGGDDPVANCGGLRGYRGCPRPEVKISSSGCHMSAMFQKPVRVTISDPDSGEELETRVVANDYVLVTVGNRYVKSIQVMGRPGRATHMIAVAVEPAPLPAGDRNT